MNDYEELFIYHTNPLVNDTDGDGTWDGAEVAAGRDATFAGTRYYYDRIDRLVGGEYEKGLSIGYQYDGNGNMLRQSYLGRDGTTNGLPDLWEFLNGLTNNTSAYFDTDGDGWSDYQEWKAGSSPTNSASIPTNTVQTKPITAIMPTPNSGGPQTLVSIRIWDGEGNASVPTLQCSTNSGSNWFTATLIRFDGTNYPSPPYFTTHPTGIVHQLTWNAGADLPPGLATNVLLQARATDVTLTGDWSPSVSYFVQICTDCDGDGLPDDWEIDYFGNNSANPEDDPDGDEFTNLQEYIADTHPNGPASYLRISGFSLMPGGVKIDWLGGIQATQYLQRKISLSDANELWLDILTNIPPTTIAGSYTDTFGTDATRFYRVRAVR